MGLETLFAELTSSQLALPVGNASLVQGDDQNLDKSRTYRWDGAKMSADVGEVLPIVYGRHIVAPNLINVYLEGGEHDTLNMLLAVCEGEIESISNIKVRGNPIENYYGEAANDPYGEFAEITTRPGTTSQSAIENFGDIHSIQATIAGLFYNEPYTYTTVRTDVECFKLEFEISELYQLDINDNEVSWYIGVKIDYRAVGDSEWIPYGVMEINKNTRSSFKRYFKSDYLTPDQYEIRLTKISENAGGDLHGNIVLTSVDEMTTQDLTYPGTALLGLRLVASEKLSKGLPNITCVVSGRKVRVPDVRDGSNNPVGWEDYYWDPGASAFKKLGTELELTWDGNTYTTAFSANPVWCLRDLLLNERYGLGQYISESDLDDSSFLAAAKFCDEGVEDENGVTEKRMRLDIVLDSRGGALETLYRICSTFRGLLSISSGIVRLVVEKAETPGQMFNMGNIIQDSFQLRYLSKKAIPTILKLNYVNKDDNYSRSTVEVADETAIVAGGAIREQSLQFIGCTRLSQALREGKILLNKLRLNRTLIQFQAAWDAISSQPGDVIRFQHDVPAWGEGGRVQAGSTSTVVKLDKTVTIELGKTYELEIRDNATDTVETRTVSETQGTYTELTVSSPFSFTPAAQDLYSFGEQNQVTKLYRIMDLGKTAEGIIAVTAVEYNANAYDYSGIVFPEEDWSYLTLEIPDASNVKAEEQVTRLGDGTIDDVVNLSWTKPVESERWVKKVTKFETWVSDNDGKSWEYVGETDKEMHQVRRPFVVGNAYTFAVVSVTEEGERKVPANSPNVSVVIQGWGRPPNNVEGFSYSFEEGIQFTWDAVTDENLAGYEIRTNNLNWGTNDSNRVWQGRAEKFYLERPTAREGVTYYIKAYNTSAKYSNQAAVLTPINPAPSAVALSYSLVFQKAWLMWQDSTDEDLVEYEVWENDSSDWTGTEVGNERLVHKSKGTSAMVLVPFKPTYFRVRPVDKYGAGEWSNWVSVTPVQLTGADIEDDAITDVHIKNGSVTAAKILAGSIQAAHIAARSIIAEHMQVWELSAITANLGCMTAGTIVGACIKSSNALMRTEMNSQGFYGYDVNGNLTIKLASGRLCMIDGCCSCNYSKFDAGALKFYHKWGEIPHVKQICAGVACTASTVCLRGWYEQPEVSVGVRRLTAYDSGSSESCQEWCVYAENFRAYGDPTASSNFGWMFDVHAKLSVAGGTRAECVYFIDFDTTRCTGVNTCAAFIKSMWQLACHGVGEDTWKYGCSCYEVRYRVCGCGVWCSKCFVYEQPHASISQLGTSYLNCVALSATELTPPDEFAIQLHELCLYWKDTGWIAGQECCCTCCYQYTADASYWVTCCYQGARNNCLYRHRLITTGLDWGDQCYCYECYTHPVYFGSNSKTRCGEVCLGYSFCGLMEIMVPPPAGHGHTKASVSVAGCYGGAASLCDSWSVYYPNGLSQAYAKSGSWSGTYDQWQTSVPIQLTFMNRMGACVWCGQCCYPPQCWWVRSSVCVCQAWQTACEKVCVTCCCTCCYQYTVYCGGSYCCNYKKWYSMQEVTSAETVLDPDGLVSFLAVAYA